MGAPSTPVTVVVPTRNVERTVAACVESIRTELAGTDYEIIVVDNGSTDATLDVVSRLPVTVVRVLPGFVSASRNAGARQASHPLLAFVDSDCLVQPGWATAIREVLADASIGVTGSRHVLRTGATWVERAWDRAHRRRADRSLVDTTYIPAGNLAVRRDVFLAVGGFDESLETGEDPDLCARIAARGLRIVEAQATRCVHLGEPRTLGAVFRRERWHGRGVRLRYGDGRIAPVTIATGLFAVLVAAGALGVIAAVATGTLWLLPVSIVLPLLVPASYAARYTRDRSLAHFGQLLAIYLAYFAGRAAALPVVLARWWRRRTPRTGADT